MHITYLRFYCAIRSCDIKRELSFFLFLGLFPLLAFSERNRGESVSSRVTDISKERNYAVATQKMGPTLAMKEMRKILHTKEKPNNTKAESIDAACLTFSIHIFAYEINVLQLLFRR